MAKSIKVNLIYNILLNISNIIFPFITAPYIARVLEPDGVGLYNFAYTVAGYFALVACLGVPTYGIRIVGVNRDNFEKLNKVFSELFSILLYMTVALVTIYFMLVFFVPKFSENATIFIISGFALYVIPFKVDWFFSGLQQFGYIAARSIIIKTISVFALFLLVHEKSDLIVYVSISAFSIAANEVWNFFKLLRTGIKIRVVTKGCSQHIKPILILFSSFFATAIYTSLGTILLGFVCEYDEVGFYNSASHICKVAIPVVTSLATVALPQIANYINNNQYTAANDLINKSVSLTLFMAVPLSVILCIIAPDFVPLFFGDKFSASIVPMQILSLLVTVVGLNNITGIQILIGMGKDEEFLKSVVFSAVISIIIYAGLTPVLGAIGASIGTVAAESLILLISYIYVSKVTPVKINIGRDLLTTLISAFILASVFLLLKQFMDGWRLIIIGTSTASVAYLICQYWMGNKTTLVAINLLLKKVHLK